MNTQKIDQATIHKPTSWSLAFVVGLKGIEWVVGLIINVLNKSNYGEDHI